MSKKRPDVLQELLTQLERLADKHPDVASQVPEETRRAMEEFYRQTAHLRQLDLHECEMEEKALNARNKEMVLGQWFGLVIGMTAILSGAVTAAMGSQWAGGFIGGGGVIGLVSVFVLGRRKL